MNRGFQFELKEQVEPPPVRTPNKLISYKGEERRGEERRNRPQLILLIETQHDVSFLSMFCKSVKFGSC